MPGAGTPEPEYIAARRVLLDALEAIGKHRKAVVLVGAQAIYLHVGEGDLAVAPYTTDGDLAIDPRELDDEPALAATLEAAGFELTVRPGTWTMSEVQIDLLVPASLGGPGRRGARLGVHGTEVARKATGLEAAVVDHAQVQLASRTRIPSAAAQQPSGHAAALHRQFTISPQARAIAKWQLQAVCKQSTPCSHLAVDSCRSASTGETADF